MKSQPKEKTTGIQAKLAQFFNSLHINNRFFYVLMACIVLFMFGFIYPSLFLFSKLFLFAVSLIFLLDGFTLYFVAKGIEATRILPEKFSNGDQNPISITIENRYTIAIIATIIDELPFQFQIRDFSLTHKLKPQETKKLNYELKPTQRGEYHFGDLLVYTKSSIGFVSRKFTFETPKTVKTYPSFLQLKKYDLLAFNQQSRHHGIKKIRRIGHSFEFEQIKEYVQGDIIRDINWKATAKRNQLMVNQFQDEKSQHIYTIIDKGRVMKMPFDGLSLLDHAINASLIINSVALRKHDKAGSFSFSKKIDNFVVAEKRNSQMNLILESLYNVKTDFHESDYSYLYATVKRNIRQRSLLILFTNFESLDAVHRQMNYLRGINKNHLLVVVFFKNTHLEEIAAKPAKTIQEIYDKTIAEKFMNDKKLIVSELKKYGIHTLLSSPKDLTIDTINKYLEIKARGLL
ncbi:DUF58 domain-containing protein [Flavicella sediminum]|uniref:DUF58 domain-containing protein n=1 Tax=Flavicella sediminum TaxID=2585141 RepID=UPI001FB7F156|nr:DUF58 domain-containing protein [Flavicella sediminum]